MQRIKTWWGGLSVSTHIVVFIVGFGVLEAGYITVINSGWSKASTVRMYARMEAECAAKNHGVVCPKPSYDDTNPVLYFSP